MGSRRQTRVVAACACVALGFLATALVRRAGGGTATRDAERGAFLADRRERMRTAREALLTASDRTG
jgi:hypothetical protein